MKTWGTQQARNIKTETTGKDKNNSMNKQNKWNGPVFGGPKILDDLAWTMGMGTFGFLYISHFMVWCSVVEVSTIFVDVVDPTFFLLSSLLQAQGNN